MDLNGLRLKGNQNMNIDDKAFYVEYLREALPENIYNSGNWIIDRSIIRTICGVVGVSSLIFAAIAEYRSITAYRLFFFSMLLLSIVISLLLKPFSRNVARIIAKRVIDSNSFNIEVMD